MERIYEVDMARKKDAVKILEAEPYQEDSFARAGYKLRDGASLGGDKNRIYLYISASEDFLKKADARLKSVASPMKGEKAQQMITRIKEEEESAESGLGSIFGG